MDTKRQIEENINKLDNNFDMLISSNNLNINSIETLALNSVEDYREIINSHIEERIIKIDEKELISKKNKNGKKEDLN